MLKSGKVLIAGGHEKSLGIGQTFPVEFYDPQTHTFEGYGCLDVKRTMAEAVEMDSGHVVITDFGISKILDPRGVEATVLDPVQTIVSLKNGEKPVMGSIGYMAPEVEMGLQATQKSDFYALGVMVYKLLTGIWCDAKTDVSGTLETYDPVWKRIIPKLLHSNPEGRESLSFSEEKSRDREKQDIEWESRWLSEKSRGRFFRLLARFAVAAFVVLLAVFCRQLWKSRADREALRQKYEADGLRPQGLLFDELFKIPPEAKSEEQTNEDGDVVMCSRAQFAAARVDALVLTHSTMSGLASRSITLEKAILNFQRIYAMLDDTSPASPFDNLSFGSVIYPQFGETQPLRMLFERAIKKLKALAED